MGKLNRRRSFAFYIHCWLYAYGIDLHKMIRALAFTPTYFLSFLALRKHREPNGLSWSIKPNYPQLSDYSDKGGTARGHYFHQDLYVASRVFEANPLQHVDVGSRVDGFVAHVASFREIKVFDIRPNILAAHRIRFTQCDLMNPPSELVSICDSLSCLHALEHFGLGRYGDPIMLMGYENGFNGLAQLLSPGGRLYLSVPIGPRRIEYNAHRVFSFEDIPRLAASQFRLDRFAFVDDAGDFYTVPVDEAKAATNKLIYGCGIYEFVKNS